MNNAPDFVAQTTYSSLGRHAPRIQALPASVDLLCGVARNVIGHYRVELPNLPVDRRFEVDLRWLAAILDVDAKRHFGPLTEPRASDDRVAGCCRDHTLFVVGALREHGIPARSRVGFAHYFSPGWAHDHVIVEFWQQGRWQRADPELLPNTQPWDVHDIPRGDDSPFETAAEAWLNGRTGKRDLSKYGVFPGSDVAGPGFVRELVIREVAHRYGDELLLWDRWGSLEEDDIDTAFIDDLAYQLVRADAGDAATEAELRARYRQDSRLRPNHQVVSYSPYGGPPRTINL